VAPVTAKSQRALSFAPATSRKETSMKHAPVLRLLGLLALSFFLMSCEKKGVEGPAQAPDFKLPDLDGRRIALSDFKGRVVLLNFWATWCPPCKGEVPELVALQSRYQSAGLDIIGVSLDDAPVEHVRQFKEVYRINYVVLYAGGEKEKLIRRFGNFRGIPATFLIDREGRIVKQVTGYMPGSFWEKEIQAVL
jgi:peroxiredoxin